MFKTQRIIKAFLVIIFGMGILMAVAVEQAIQSPSEQADPIILQAATHIIEEHFKTKVELSSAVVLSEEERRNVIMRLIINKSSSWNS